MPQKVRIFCPDCRGRFFVDRSDIVEEDVLECPLCSAEIEILSEDPIQIRLVQDEY